MKRSSPICPFLWMAIATFTLCLNLGFEFMVAGKLFDFMNITCNINQSAIIYNTSSTNLTNITRESTDCVYILVLAVGVICVSIFVFVLLMGFVFLISYYISRTNQLQMEIIKLERENTNQQRQPTERIGNNFGRPNNDLPPYTALPNERGQLLTQNQLPNYQSAD